MIFPYTSCLAGNKLFLRLTKNTASGVLNFNDGLIENWINFMQPSMIFFFLSKLKGKSIILVCEKFLLIIIRQNKYLWGPYKLSGRIVFNDIRQFTISFDKTAKSSVCHNKAWRASFIKNNMINAKILQCSLNTVIGMKRKL